MKESGLQWSLITEDEQERQMQRWIGAADFSEHGLESIAAASVREQYAREHSEQPLLAFVISETTQCLYELAQRRAEAESDKFVKIASMNIVNCIAGASTSSFAPG